MTNNMALGKIKTCFALKEFVEEIIFAIENKQE